MTRQGNSPPLHSCSSPHPALCSYNLLAPPISPEPQQSCLPAQFRCHFVLLPLPGPATQAGGSLGHCLVLGLARAQLWGPWTRAG